LGCPGRPRYTAAPDNKGTERDSCPIYGRGVVAAVTLPLPITRGLKVVGQIRLFKAIIGVTLPLPITRGLKVGNDMPPRYGWI